MGRKNLKPKWVDVENWQCLRMGDRIKSIQGYGPEITLKNGDRCPMGEYGYYEVVSVEPQGLFVKGDGAFGTVFIYMGEARLMSTGTMMVPHKLKVLKRPQ